MLNTAQDALVMTQQQFSNGDNVFSTAQTKGNVRRSTKLANFVCLSNWPTKICHPPCKNRPDFLCGQNRPILLSNTKYILFSTTKLANFLDIGHHGDCLQSEMNIYFVVTLWCLFSFIRCRKKCKYHFAIFILLLCIREASWYRKVANDKINHVSWLDDFIGRFSRATKLRP